MKRERIAFAGLLLLLSFVISLWIWVKLSEAQIKVTVMDSANQPVLQGTLWIMNIDCVSNTGTLMLKESKADLVKGLCPTCPSVGAATATINGISAAISAISISTTPVSTAPTPPPTPPPPTPTPTAPCAGFPVVQPSGTFPTFFVGPKPNTKDGLIAYLKAVAPGDPRACPWLIWAQQSQANLDWVWAQSGYKLKRWYQAPNWPRK